MAPTIPRAGSELVATASARQGGVYLHCRALSNRPFAEVRETDQGEYEGARLASEGKYPWRAATRESSWSAQARQGVVPAVARPLALGRRDCVPQPFDVAELVAWWERSLTAASVGA